MPHGIEQILVKNFKSCGRLRLRLSDYTPIVGNNNAGKSNILQAISWLIQSEALASNDFRDTSRPVIVEAIIGGLTEEILSHLGSAHRSKIEKYVQNNSISIRRKMDSPGSASQGKLQILDPEKRASLTEAPTDNDEGDALLEPAWDINPAGISQAIQALFPEPFFIGAMENAADDAGKTAKGSTLGKLIAELSEPVEAAHRDFILTHIEAITGLLNSPGKDRAKELIDFEIRGSEIFAEFFPGMRLRIDVPAPTINDLLKLGTIKLAEQDSEFRDFRQYGHGAQRSAQMALIRLLAEKARSKSAEVSRRMLLIEEPELYLHPKVIESIREAFRVLGQSGYQLVVATHSPLMICQESLPDALLIRKTVKDGTICRPTIRDAIKSEITESKSQARVLLSLTHTNLWLFAHQVLLCEGATEHKLMPWLYKKCLNKTLSLSNIALVSQGGSANTERSIAIFTALGIPVKALVDLDFAFRTATQSGLLKREDPIFEKAKEIFKSLAIQKEFNLAEDGFPCRGGKLNAAEAFAEFAKQKAAEEVIGYLHAQLLAKGIWMWKRGTIENHLGIVQKSEDAWAEFLEKGEEADFDSFIPDSIEVRKFCDWLAAK